MTVYRWRGAPPPTRVAPVVPVAVLQQQAHTARKTRGWAANLIACPTCLARIDQPCRTPGGYKSRPHQARLVTRRCPCGNHPATPRAVFCPACAAANRAEIVAVAEAKRTRGTKWNPLTPATAPKPGMSSTPATMNPLADPATTRSLSLPAVAPSARRWATSTPCPSVKRTTAS